MTKTSPKPRQLLSCNGMIQKIDALQDGRPDHRLELAAGMPKNKLNKIRTGKQYMRADEIWRISRVLDVPVRWLLNDAETEMPAKPKPYSDLEVSISGCDDANGKTDRRNKPKVGKTKDAPLS